MKHIVLHQVDPLGLRPYGLITGLPSYLSSPAFSSSLSYPTTIPRLLGYALAIPPLLISLSLHLYLSARATLTTETCVFFPRS